MKMHYHFHCLDQLVMISRDAKMFVYGRVHYYVNSVIKQLISSGKTLELSILKGCKPECFDNGEGSQSHSAAVTSQSVAQ